MTLWQFKQNAIKKLSGSPSPALDVDVLLQWILQKDKTFILFNRDLELNAEQEIWLWNAIEKRCTGLPVAYITGTKEFFDGNLSGKTTLNSEKLEILNKKLASELQAERLEHAQSLGKK